MAFSVNTLSGGLVELNLITDRFHGSQLYMHVDQSTNLRNGDGDCSIALTNTEVKGIIAMLNEYLIHTEGVTHVLLAAPLLHDAVTITIDKSKLSAEELPPEDLPLE